LVNNTQLNYKTHMHELQAICGRISLSQETQASAGVQAWRSGGDVLE
jgi:hypothetical protein